jgi:MFS family permease
MPSRLAAWIGGKGLSRDFWLFFVAALFFDFGISMFLFLYNLFLLDIGFAERQLGLIVGAMTIGGVVGTLPMGWLTQRVGLRRVLLGGFIVTPLFAATRTMVFGERSLILLAFLGGISICSWAVCFAPAAARLTTEENRTFAFSLLFSVGIATGGLGGLVGGYLPGWLQVIQPSLHAVDAKRLVLLLCCVTVMIGAWPMSRLKLHLEREGQNKSWRFPPFLVRYLPAAALWNLASGAFVPFATAYLSRYMHVPLTHIGLIVSASQMAQVVAILLAPAVFRRCGLVIGIMYTQMATAIALAGLAKTHNLPLVVGLFLSFTAFHWMGGPGIYTLLMNRVAEADRSSASAANNLVTSLCQALASALGGAAYADFGYPLVLAAIAGIALLAALLFWVLLREPNNGDAIVAVPAEC